MKTRMLALFMIILLGSAFAAPPPWAGTALSALMLSFTVLAILYAVAIAFSLPSMKFLATDELHQLLVTAVMIVFMFSLESATNEIFAPITDGAGTLQEVGLEKVDSALAEQVGMYNALKGYTIKIVPQSAKSLYCGLSGAGFYVSPCGSFSALTPPLTMSMQAISLSIAELSSLRTLVAFGGTYALSLLFPIGIILRTLRFSRGAGAIFIGLGVSLYIFVPMTAIFMDEITNPPGAPGRPDLPEVSGNMADYTECNPFWFSTEIGFSYANADTAKERHFDPLADSIDDFLYLFLIRGTMFTVGTLVAFYSTFKWIAKLAGAEVRLMTLMRIA